MPLMPTCVADVGVRRSAQAMRIASTTTSSTTQTLSPSSWCTPVARTTPSTTPALRSSPFTKDWLMLGCTTSSAAMAAKVGNGPWMSSRQRSTAATTATAVFTTCRKGVRLELRSLATGFTTTTVATSRTTGRARTRRNRARHG